MRPNGRLAIQTSTQRPVIDGALSFWQAGIGSAGRVKEGRALIHAVLGAVSVSGKRCGLWRDRKA